MRSVSAFFAAALVWLGAAAVSIGGTISIPFPGPGGVGTAFSPPSITFTDHTSDGTNQASYSFASRSIGAANATRIVGICLAGISGSGTISWSGVTIGGVSATLQKNQQNTVSGTTAAIFTAAVPTGTTATVAATASSSMVRLGLGIWSMLNLSNSGTASATNGSNTSPAVLDLNVNAGDVGIVCGFNNNTPPTATATAGWTEDYDNNTGAENSTDAGGNFTAAVAGSPRTITLTWAGVSSAAASSANFR